MVNRFPIEEDWSSTNKIVGLSIEMDYSYRNPSEKGHTGRKPHQYKQHWNVESIWKQSGCRLRKIVWTMMKDQKESFMDKDILGGSPTSINGIGMSRVHIWKGQWHKKNRKNSSGTRQWKVMIQRNQKNTEFGHIKKFMLEWSQATLTTASMLWHRTSSSPMPAPPAPC